jgi:hypothetical protein
MPTAKNRLMPTYIPFSAMVDEENVHVHGMLSGPWWIVRLVVNWFPTDDIRLA